MVRYLCIDTHNTRRKLNLHVQHYSTVPSKKNVINMGLRLYNKVLDEIGLREILKSFENDLKSSLVNFNFVDEFMSF
jgi:hypothetical protein